MRSSALRAMTSWKQSAMPHGGESASLTTALATTSLTVSVKLPGGKSRGDAKDPAEPIRCTEYTSLSVFRLDCRGIRTSITTAVAGKQRRPPVAAT